jgi:soluble lytic murein transglycosylase-like protein
MSFRRTSAAFVFVFVALFATSAAADLYKYRKPNGEIIITSDRRSDLELVEVVSSKSGKKRKVRKRTRKRAPGKTRVNGKELNTEPHPENDVPRANRESAFDDIIREASEAYDVPFEFVKAVIRVESNFNPNATSHAGAMGLMQLMPRTAASLNVTDPYDPRQNIFGGTRFLRILIDRYDGDINLILAAYNAGDVAVARYDGIPYPKTRGYVSSVYQWYQQYSAANDQ